MAKTRELRQQLERRVQSTAAEDDDTLAADLLRGVDQIAEFIGEKRRRTYYLLEGGAIPCGKQGALWLASRRTLREHYAKLTGSAA
jgi:hypothetical protein